jgi:CRP-like cAMP-binding protein
LYEASEGETFGEIPLLDNEATLSHLAAGDRGAVTVLIPKRTLEGACRSDAALALRLARATAHRARILTERLEDLAFASTTTRIARVILSFAPNSNGATPDWVEAPIELRQLSQTRIADLAGTVRVVVARALRTLTDDGALVMDHGRVVRLNRAALAHVL